VLALHPLGSAEGFGEGLATTQLVHLGFPVHAGDGSMGDRGGDASRKILAVALMAVLVGIAAIPADAGGRGGGGRAGGFHRGGHHGGFHRGGHHGGHRHGGFHHGGRTF